MLEFLVLTCLNCSSWEQEELFIYTSIKSSKYNRKVYKIAYSPIGLPASLLISPNIGNLTPICLLSIVIGPTSHVITDGLDAVLQSLYVIHSVAFSESKAFPKQLCPLRNYQRVCLESDPDYFVDLIHVPDHRRSDPAARNLSSITFDRYGPRSILVVCTA